jgi:peptide/nickel transport system substrate-binding protein
MGGDVWENGFQFEILYNEGNNIRQVASRLIAENVSKINDNFQIDTRAVPWPDFLDRIQTGTMPMFVIGWAPDYPDPDNFVTPFMHGQKGTFASWVNYNNERVNELIDEAGTTLNQEERREMYYELQQIYLDDVVGIMTHQPVEQRFYRDWVEGNFYNPMQSSQFDLLPYIEKEQ